MATASLQIGQWVSVRSQEGQVCFVGPTGFAEGEWIGIELVRAVGRNDGSVRGIRYFVCELRHGLFVQRAQCAPIAGPTGRSGSECDPDEVSAAWAAIEMVDEAAALHAGRESQRVIEHLTQAYPANGAAARGAAAKQPTAPKKPAPLKKRESSGMLGQRGSGRAHVNTALSEGGDAAYYAVMNDLSLPTEYTGPRFESDPTAEDMEALLQYIKKTVDIDIFIHLCIYTYIYVYICIQIHIYISNRACVYFYIGWVATTQWLTETRAKEGVSHKYVHVDIAT